ncbi:unnamed protein product [Microthlaspi erraticum]|uniref:Uncharacterized protein n=1 Tax=Microthlaspi erraticum TaxID=1685480 RepID=A0A6D2J9L1_9BRAS|nr:unnamed protein product [Microthlaspi erraticum]
MTMASAKVKEHGLKLEPDGVKDLKLEPVEQLEREGSKLVAEDELEPELVAEEALAAPMKLVTHSRVNLEPKWRQHDPKPPWFLIQAQEINKWACVSFVLFFPCQVLSQWVFLTRSFGAFWSIWEEHGGTWHMEAAQLDTQRKKGEAILKTSSTVYSTNRSSSSTRPAKLQLDRAEKSKSNPKNVASPLTFL